MQIQGFKYLSRQYESYKLFLFTPGTIFSDMFSDLEDIDIVICINNIIFFIPNVIVSLTQHHIMSSYYIKSESPNPYIRHKSVAVLPNAKFQK